MLSLTTSFVPVAEAIRRVHGRPFLKPILAAGRHVVAGCQTERGIYAFAPDGRFLASTHEAAPILVSRTLERALERFRAMKARHEGPIRPATYPRVRAYPKWPAHGLVTKVTVRDLGRSPGQRRTRQPEWNHDNAWFDRRDVAALVPPETARRRPEVGMRFTVASALVERLARLHLLDHARAGTPPFAPRHVRKATLTGTVTEVSGDGISIRYEGETDCEGPYRRLNRGVTLRLFGLARYDRAAARFRTFDLIALGTRRGHTEYNGRTAEGRTSRIGILLRRIDPDRASAPTDFRLPPTYIHAYGWRR